MQRRELLKGIAGLAGYLPVFGQKRAVSDIIVPGIDTSSGVALLEKPAMIVPPNHPALFGDSVKG